MRKTILGIGCLLSSWLYAVQPNIVLKPIAFSNLSNWQQTNAVLSFLALQKSCQVILAPNAEESFKTTSIPLTKNDWREACHAALQMKTVNQQSVKYYFEKYFQPYSVQTQQGKTGLFTGYYLPSVPASLTRTSIYTVPVFGRPKDLVTVKLGLFNPLWQGKKISGRLVDGRVYPYTFTRKQIDQGALDDNVPVIVWVKNRADRFFVQIQGSAIAILPDGKKVLLGYDGDNGQKYYPIGRWFIEQGILDRDHISMQKIHAWLLAHPQQADDVMQKDASFVFMKALNSSSPIGTEKVPLTDGYSLAVDNTVIPLGVPLWLVTTVPDPKQPNNHIDFNRLMIAQDTGGAIRGGVRGDIYFGSSKDAETQAGYMQNVGQYWILLPKHFQD